jgi:hypothetical protein
MTRSGDDNGHVTGVDCHAGSAFCHPRFMTGVTSRQLQSAPTVVSTAKPDGATTKETKAVTTPREPNDVSELSIAEQLVLVARVGSRARPAPLRLRYGALAAVLVDLERAGRLQMADGNVTPLDPTATGDALADVVLGVARPRAPAPRGCLDTSTGGSATARTERGAIVRRSSLDPVRRGRARVCQLATAAA